MGRASTPAAVVAVALAAVARRLTAQRAAVGGLIGAAVATASLALVAPGPAAAVAVALAALAGGAIAV
ncbi:MAG: hypothetical protein KA201_34550, partial [Kofleriaceae bacterium]|nr:hypothetical protein [Kofleriaceae bacterium]